MARLTKAVKLTGAQVDALLTLNDEALREALYRLRAQTKAPSVEETAAEIVNLLTAPTADEQILAAMVGSAETREPAVRLTATQPIATNLTERLDSTRGYAYQKREQQNLKRKLKRRAGVQATDDGEA